MHSFCLVHIGSVMQVLVRGRLLSVRGKGKACFIVLRQEWATVQVRASKKHIR